MKNFRNIVLIGMPSCGKSTIGKLLAEACDKTFVDIDEEIIKKTQMSIPQIFKEKKEEGFRTIESEVLSLVMNENKQVIATGGGIITIEKNIPILKKDNIVVFIDRSLDKLTSYDPNRPLSSSKEAVKKLYEQRYMLYNKYADIIVENNDNIETCVNEIIQKYNLFK